MPCIFLTLKGNWETHLRWSAVTLRKLALPDRYAWMGPASFDDFQLPWRGLSGGLGDRQGHTDQHGPPKMFTATMKAAAMRRISATPGGPAAGNTIPWKGISLNPAWTRSGSELPRQLEDERCQPTADAEISRPLPRGGA